MVLQNPELEELCKFRPNFELVISDCILNKWFQLQLRIRDIKKIFYWKKWNWKEVVFMLVASHQEKNFVRDGNSFFQKKCDKLDIENIKLSTIWLVLGAKHEQIL